MPRGFAYLSACFDIFLMSFNLQPVTLKDSTGEPLMLFVSFVNILGAIAAFGRRIMDRATSKVV